GRGPGDAHARAIPSAPLSGIRSVPSVFASARKKEARKKLGFFRFWYCFLGKIDYVVNCCGHRPTQKKEYTYG
ncbi:MAG: hypothetical protein PHV28_13310, partial [Kiritimatiellae bacterium]|nr:hypothetical protein [Kiritimatiellia bacterium]